MARAAVATTTVPPAKTTAAPEEPIASAERVPVVLAGAAVLPVAGDDEQGVVDADAEPDQAATGMAETDTSIALASTVMPPMPAPTATSESPIGRTRGHDGAEHDQQDEERDQEADADVAGVVVPALRKTASPPSSTRTPSAVHAGDARRRARRTPACPSRARGRRGSARRSRCGRRARPCRPRTGRRRTRRGRGSATSVEHARRPRRGGSASVVPSSACEDDEGRALGGLGEVLVEQLHGPGALAAGCGEVVGEGAAAAAARKSTAPSDEDPAGDGAPGVPGAGHGDAAGEPVHGRAFVSGQ